MPKQPSHHPKHIPQRTCVGCREVNAKRALIRLVRTENGVQIDPTGKASGRGAYLHDQRSCWQKAMKGALANALRMSFTDDDRQRLAAFIAELPEHESSGVK
jgi:hypothetical protein